MTVLVAVVFFLLDILIPTITTMVLSTSDAEWTASETIALEWPSTPAISFPADKIILPAIETKETLIAIFLLVPYPWERLLS